MTELGLKENVNFGVLTGCILHLGCVQGFLGGGGRVVCTFKDSSFPPTATVEFNLSRKAKSLYARDIVAMQQRNTI